MSLRIRKGTEAQRLGIVFDLGEIVWTTDGEKLYVGDGVTFGGKSIAAQLAGTGLRFDAATGTLESSATFDTDAVSEGNNNLYFTNQRAQEGVWVALQAGANLGNVEFTYDDVNQALYGNVVLDGGLLTVEADTAPKLGGNLDLNNNNITGLGDVNITGNLKATGTVSATQGLGADLNLNGYDILGTGSLSVSGTISTVQGLGSDLNLNGNDITGTGNVSLVGDVAITGNISGTGNIDMVGNISVTGAGNSIYGFHTGSFVGTAAITDLVAVGGTDKPETASSHYAVTDKTNGAWVDLNVATVDITNPTPVEVGDTIGGFKVNVYTDVNTFKPIAAFSATLDASATLTADNPATILTLGVGKETGFTRFEFKPSGEFVAPVLQTGVYSTSPDDLRPANPAKGMIIFNDTAGTFEGYNGTAWVTLG